MICSTVTIFICCFCSVLFWYRKFKQANEINLLASAVASQQQQYGSSSITSNEVISYESAIRNSQLNDHKADILPTYDQVNFVLPINKK